jgi:rhodanese-related sulfurtransferase
MIAPDMMDAPRAFLPHVFRQAGVLLLAALVPALLAAAFHPRRPAWSRDQAMIPEVAWSTVQQWPGLRLLVDARSEVDFRRRHIPGAFPLDEARWEARLPAVIQAWQPGARVVVYCDNLGCESSQAVARRLRRELGINDVFVLKGGWSAWLEAQKPGP